MLRSRSRSRGQAVVEFALSIGIAFTLIFGIIDFGRALYTYDLVTSAARIGSRYAIVHGSSCTLAACPASSAAIQTYVQSKVTGVNTSQLSVVTTWATATGCTDANHQGPLCIVKVTVTYPFQFVILYHTTLTMTSTSQMVISQ